MADRSIDYLIIGGGVAGYSCARTLREAGAEGTITLVTRDPDPPYDRTAVSKAYLQGRTSREETMLASPEWWEEQGVELLTRTSALGLDLDARTVKLSNKTTVGFGRLLLATGANIRRLRVDGSDLEGIHYVRALGNADTIRRDVEEADRVVMVGGSYIATEVAASLTALGKRCALVMQEGVTLERAVGQQAGRFFQDVLERNGVEVHGDDEVERFEGEDGRVTAVVTKGGKRVEADAVVVGAGVMPDVMLAQRAGLEIGERGGVRTDAALRTSAEGVFAAGDMAEYESPVHGGEHVRIEHWDVAEQQGATAARSMLGGDGAHDVVPYFFSDLSDWSSMEFVGAPREWDEEIVRGSIDSGAFTIWYLLGGRVAGALSVGRGDDLEAARALILSGADVSDRRDALADPDAPLESLSAPADASSA
ncbi:MAG: 3-phenylpropionate/trans-cinnamate dioxygenase ferredoxin reductase component [Solirubrobacteraceae bacterium]|nr:3-phenylpropionate/trans-cinnamate dioxygenase ferredoxin reductase component [Solirubrobacteraceae bacterium]